MHFLSRGLVADPAKPCLKEFDQQVGLALLEGVDAVQVQVTGNSVGMLLRCSFCAMLVVNSPAIPRGSRPPGLPPNFAIAKF